MNLINPKEEEKIVSDARVRRQAAPWVLLLGIIFIAINMRAPLTSVGPLVEMIREHLYISNTLAGMITTLPLLAFAIISPFVPKLSQRYGTETVLFVAMILLASGILLRSVAGISILYIGTAILGIGIAACNVLLPSLIKREYPERIGLMTGVYSISMNLFGAIASGISIPVAVGLGYGWQGALAIWGGLSILAIVFWLPQVKRRPEVPALSNIQTAKKPKNLWQSGLAWQVTIYMGLQSTLFYVLVTWLPEILNQRGLTPDQAGWMLSFMQMAVLPVTFIAPILAGRMKNQRLLMIFSSFMILLGLVGLHFGSMRLTLLWVFILGIGSGFAFGLAMILFSLRTKTAKEAAELSGMAQSFGYLLAALGPMIFGYLHDATNGWNAPLYLLMAVAILIGVFGVGAGRDQFVGDN